MNTRLLVTILCAVGLTAHCATFTVTNTLDSGAGSLRQAILSANANSGDFLGSLINFNIPGTGPHIIMPESELPRINGSIYFTTISGNNIVLDGRAAGPNANGLVVQVFVQVYGLTITNFTDSGILIDFNGTGNTISGCRITGNAKAGIESDGNINSILNNTITGNGDEGVFVSLNHIRNQISGNSIFGNGKLGIDVAPGGTNTNDDCDRDSGANNLQNSPVLTSATSVGNKTTITGTLNSIASRIFFVEFFANSVCDDSGSGEGELSIGSSNIMTTAFCTAPINVTFTLPGGLPNGTFITATATDGTFHDTSEFSACVPVVVVNNPPTASNDVYSTDLNRPFNVPAPGVLTNDSDPEGAPLAAVQVTGPAHGSGTINADGSLNYSPALAFSGLDIVSYRASDGTNNSADAVVAISIGADTLTGGGVNVQLHADVIGIDPISITYAGVNAPGSTKIAPIDPSLAGTLPDFYFVYSNLVFDVTTTANVTGRIDLCFTVTLPVTFNQFAMLRVLHNEGGRLFDRTTVSNFATKTICAQVPSFSPFVIALFAPPPPETHDLAITKIKAPKNLNLNSAPPAHTKRVTVTLQNRGAHSEVITNQAQLAALLRLEVHSLDTNECADIVPVLLEGPPQKKFPITLKAKAKLNVFFDVTFNCAVDPEKTTRNEGHADFSYVARVYHEALDGVADTHPECDVCPRGPQPDNHDPNPNGKILDKGCGAPAGGGGILGNPVLTDVFLR